MFICISLIVLVYLCDIQLKHVFCSFVDFFSIKIVGCGKVRYIINNNIDNKMMLFDGLKNICILYFYNVLMSIYMIYILLYIHYKNTDIKKLI